MDTPNKLMMTKRRCPTPSGTDPGTWTCQSRSIFTPGGGRISWLLSVCAITLDASMRTRCARLTAVAALVVGIVSVAVAVTSLVLFIVLGPGREAYTRLNSLLGWHGCLAAAVLPLAVVALCLGRVRSAVLAFGLCLGSWFVTTALVANTFRGDRPPPDYRSALTPNYLVGATNCCTTSRIRLSRAGLKRYAVGVNSSSAAVAHEDCYASFECHARLLDF